MIPLLLKMQGVYSYIDEQQIDFTELIAAGLFGIFGQVGAGKSSIIESIVVALYGKNERLSSTHFWYNMLNLKCNSGYVIFDFEFEHKIYRFEVRWKRNSKKFDDVDGKRYAYIQNNKEWESLEHADAQKILGLSYDHFKRTTIIPQGKFKEFLELTPAYRTGMIKEIFELYRFDLKDKIKHKYDQVEAKKLVLDGVLQTYQDFDAAAIAANEQLIHDAQQELEQLQEKWAYANNQLEAYKKLAEQWIQYETIESKYNAAQQELPYYQAQEQQLQKYISTHQAFDALVKKEHLFAEQIQKTQTEAAAENTKKSDYDASLKQLQEALKPIQLQYDSLSDKRLHLTELDSVKKIIECKNNNESLTTRISKGEQHVAQQVDKRNAINAAIEQIKISLQETKMEHLSLQTIDELTKWINQKEQLAREELVLQNQANDLSIKLNAIQQDSISKGFDLNNLTSYDEALLNLKQQHKALKTEEQNIQVQLQLNSYAQNLVPGAPCPLCGATSHEHIMEPKDINEQLIAIQNQIHDLEQQQQALETSKQYAWTKQQEYTHTKQQKENLIVSIEKIKNDTLSHIQSYSNTYYSLDNLEAFEQDKKIFIQITQEREEQNKKLQSLQSDLDKAYAAVQQSEQLLQEIKQTYENNLATIKVHFQSIKSIDGNYYATLEMDAIHKQQEHIQQQIEATERTYEQLINNSKQLEQSLFISEGKLQSLNELLAQLQEQYNQVHTELQSVLKAHNFSDLNEVKLILNNAINVQETQQKIKVFFETLHTYKQQYEDLQNELKDKKFDAQKLNELTVHAYDINTQREDKLGAIAQLKSRLAHLQKQLEEVTAHKKDHDEIVYTLAHLEKLKGMFNGDKFIEFISGTYLRQLCDYANTRFHKLTKNQLSLTINDKMEFEIIDYLNGGKPRSVKTLSGGQAFQASLCLALALAESVQAKNKQEQNFFFIDEGFGTQDKNSIPVVFETLQAISNEKRIVGIISHVEELQENISRYLYVQKEESGSKIYQC